jgi:hypothetical protein
MKSLSEILNLKEIVEIVLRDYPLSEQQRLEAADRIYERYKNLVKEIAMKIIPREAEKSAILRTAAGLDPLGLNR